MNVMEEFEEVCIEKNYFIGNEDVREFVKLMKFNIDNMAVQVAEVLKEMKPNLKSSPKEDVEKVKGELLRQQKLNQ